ncbi:hypothetical protein WJX74_001855 [Apatococcus lobatus]|uniref:Uncharacterized protein n=1 Tax=Apatococcus lobatus TaxID=904363 RepID=A0AAW1Q5B5_9CHLO
MSLHFQPRLPLSKKATLLPSSSPFMSIAERGSANTGKEPDVRTRIPSQLGPIPSSMDIPVPAEQAFVSKECYLFQHAGWWHFVRLNTAHRRQPTASALCKGPVRSRLPMIAADICLIYNSLRFIFRAEHRV